ncbi:MAG: hypothetical protein AB1762_22765, partial [Gemmatimonadota bacterium]
MMKRRFLVLPSVLAVVAACSGGADQQASDSSVVAAAPTANSIDLRASDFSFEAPDTTTAGPTWIRMTNTGKEFHHVIVVHIDSGHTVDEFLKNFSDKTPPPSWAHILGGPIAPSPAGAATSTALDLMPGKYALICVVPSADGVPHVAKGMVREMTVTAPAAAAAAAPITPTTTLTLSDYSFTASSPLTAGKNIIRVVNTASQPHEVVIVRIFAGRTVGDVAAFGEKPEGPPPGEVVGGASFV